jgi:hypothetical protein
VVALDLASGLDEHTVLAGGKQNGVAPACLLACGECERRINHRLDSTMTAANTRGAEYVAHELDFFPSTERGDGFLTRLSPPTSW